MLLSLASCSVLLVRSAYQLLVKNRLIPDLIMTDFDEELVSFTRLFFAFRFRTPNSIRGRGVGQP